MEEGFLLFSTKKRGRNKEKDGEEIRNFGQIIYRRDEVMGTPNECKSVSWTITSNTTTIIADATASAAMVAHWYRAWICWKKILRSNVCWKNENFSDQIVNLISSLPSSD